MILWFNESCADFLNGTWSHLFKYEIMDEISSLAMDQNHVTLFSLVWHEIMGKHNTHHRDCKTKQSTIPPFVLDVCSLMMTTFICSWEIQISNWTWEGPFAVERPIYG